MAARDPLPGSSLVIPFSSPEVEGALTVTRGQKGKENKNLRINFHLHHEDKIDWQPGPPTVAASLRPVAPPPPPTRFGASSTGCPVRARGCGVMDSHRVARLPSAPLRRGRFPFVPRAVLPRKQGAGPSLSSFHALGPSIPQDLLMSKEGGGAEGNRSSSNPSASAAGHSITWLSS